MIMCLIRSCSITLLIDDILSSKLFILELFLLLLKLKLRSKEFEKLRLKRRIIKLITIVQMGTKFIIIWNGVYALRQKKKSQN
jgi:hypothetical protein